MPAGDPLLEDPFSKYGYQATDMTTPEGDDLFPQGFKRSSAVTKRQAILIPFQTRAATQSGKTGTLQSLHINKSLTKVLRNAPSTLIMGSRLKNALSFTPKTTQSLKIKAAQVAFKDVVTRTNTGGYSKNYDTSKKMNLMGLKTTRNNTGNTDLSAPSTSAQD